MADAPESKADAVASLLQNLGCLIMCVFALVILVGFIVAVIAC